MLQSRFISVNVLLQSVISANRYVLLQSAGTNRYVVLQSAGFISANRVTKCGIY